MVSLARALSQYGTGFDNIEPGKGYKMRVTKGGAAKFNEYSGRRELAAPDQQGIEAPVPSSWAFDEAVFAETMTLTAIVTVGGARQSSGVLAAFVGTDVRGVQARPLLPPFGPHAGQPMFQLTLYGKDGEGFTFQFHRAGTTTPLDRVLSFATDGNAGNAMVPYVLAEKMSPSKLFA